MSTLAVKSQTGLKGQEQSNQPKTTQTNQPTMSTEVHFLVDSSGSMYNHPLNKAFIDALRNELDCTADRLESHGLSLTFHLFSDNAITGPRLFPMPNLSGGTIIASAFEAMTKSVKAACEHCIVVFISDGEDSPGNQARRARLFPLPCKSTLLTVAVGEGFPTSLVIDELRVKYHSFGGDSIPLVFPLSNRHKSIPEMQEEIQWVTSQLEEIIQAGGIVREYSMDELASGEADTIFGQCKRWYNAATIQCMSKDSSLLRKIEIVKETKEKLSQAELLMKKITLGMGKPLPSNLKARRPLYLLTTLREKLNTLLEQLNKGRLFDELTDAEKQAYLSFGNTAGRFLPTSMKYHAANFETTKASLERLAANYTPTDEDEMLIDQLNLCSSAEYFMDARSNPHLFKDISSLAGVLEGFPFIGRAIELHERPDCVQINPWVASIRRIPRIIKTITTHSLYIEYNGEMEVSGEKANALIILGGVKDCPGIFCHLQSFALTKNWLLYFNDSRLAAASMLLVHLLGDDAGEWKFADWMLEELSHVRSICSLHTPVNSKWWHDYLGCLKTADFKDCLVTESPRLKSKCMTCPGLGKFLLAMWLSADNGHIFNDLPDRFQATAVELLGRCKLDAETFFTSSSAGKDPNSKVPNQVTKSLDSVIPALKASHLSMRKITSLLQSALEIHIKEANLNAREDVIVTFKAEELMRVAHFNLSLRHVKCFFERLCEQQGVEWAGPSDECLMKALMIATTHATSYDRSHPTCFVDATQEEIIQTMKGRMADRVGDTRKTIMSEAKKGVMAHFHFRHMGLPRQIPYEHVLRYKEETGKDIAETWQLDPETGLSPIACCFPACDLYLTIPPGDFYKQRTVMRGHLSTCCQNSIPGLHKCVARNAHLPTTEIMKLVESGAELGEPFLPRDVTRRLSKGMGVYCGVPRSFASPEQYKAHALELECKGLPAKIKASIREFTGGDSMVLYHAIDDIKISLSAGVWGYSSFRRTFDAKYATL